MCSWASQMAQWQRICLSSRRCGSVPGLERFPGEGNGNPIQSFSCLGNPMDRGAWRATVHGVAKSWTGLGTHTLKIQWAKQIPQNHPNEELQNFNLVWSANTVVVHCTHSRVRSHVWLFAKPWAVAHQAPLSMQFSQQEYWSGLPFPTPGDIPDPKIEPKSPVSSALAGRFFTTVPLGKPVSHYLIVSSQIITEGSHES